MMCINLKPKNPFNCDPRGVCVIKPLSRDRKRNEYMYDEEQVAQFAGKL